MNVEAEILLVARAKRPAPSHDRRRGPRRYGGRTGITPGRTDPAPPEEAVPDNRLRIAGAVAPLLCGEVDVVDADFDDDPAVVVRPGMPFLDLAARWNLHGVGGQP